MRERILIVDDASLAAAAIAPPTGALALLDGSGHMRALAEKNTPAGRTAFFIGAGAYRHHVPASVDHLIQRSEFLTT